MIIENRRNCYIRNVYVIFEVRHRHVEDIRKRRFWEPHKRSNAYVHSTWLLFVNLQNGRSGPGKGLKRYRFAPLPKNNSKIDTEFPNALKRLYISCSGTSEPSRKFASEIRGGRSWPKLQFPKNCSRGDFEPLKVDIALGL